MFWRRLGSQVAKPSHKINKDTKSHAEIPNGDGIFDFVFRNLETFLIIGMAFLIYALFHTFTEYVASQATFIEVKQRNQFAFNLILGLMGVEVLLALATSYFRKRSEWFKSILVTAVSLIIAYYNHLSIAEIFAVMENSSSAVKEKLMLTNWLVFGLGEIISLLMNSKGQDQQVEAPPLWFQQFWTDQQPALAGMSSSSGTRHQIGRNPNPEAQAQIGFHYQSQQNRFKDPDRIIPKRGPSIDYPQMETYIFNGLSNREIMMLMGCSESSIRKHKRKLRESGKLPSK